MTDKNWWDDDAYSPYNSEEKAPLPPPSPPLHPPDYGRREREWINRELSTIRDSQNQSSEILGVLVAFGVMAVIAVFLLSLLDSGPNIHTVRYEVSSNCETVDVFYENEWRGTSSKTVDTGPGNKWTYSYETEFDGFTFMYISGQANCDQDEVTVIATLYIDGELADWEPCEGGYCIATASDMR